MSNDYVLWNKIESYLAQMTTGRMVYQRHKRRKRDGRGGSSQSSGEYLLKGRTRIYRDRQTGELGDCRGEIPASAVATDCDLAQKLIRYCRYRALFVFEFVIFTHLYSLFFLLLFLNI